MIINIDIAIAIAIIWIVFVCFLLGAVAVAVAVVQIQHVFLFDSWFSRCVYEIRWDFILIAIVIGIARVLLRVFVAVM